MDSCSTPAETHRGPSFPQKFSGLASELEMSVPKNHPHIASGYTCLGLAEVSTLSVSDAWKTASSRKLFVKAEKGVSGEEGGRKRERKYMRREEIHQDLKTTNAGPV